MLVGNTEQAETQQALRNQIMETLGIIMHNSGLPGSGTKKASIYSAVTMSEQLVIQHLKHCRDLTRGFSYRVFPNFWRQWCKQILEIAEQAKSNKEQVALYETQNLMTAVQQAAEKEFGQHLANGFVRFKNKTLNTLTGEERFSGDILSLVEHSDLEETIAITSITHRADNFFAEQLWVIQQRLALLNDGEKLDERANPVSPVQFCESLRKVLASLDIDPKTKIIGYKLFDQDVIGMLDGLYDELNDYLIRQNLLPHLRFAPVVDRATAKEDAIPDGPSEQPDQAADESQDDPHQRQRRASDKLLTGTLSPNDIQYQNSLLNAIRLLQAHVTQQLPAIQVNQMLPGGAPSAIPAIASAPAANLQIYSQEQLVNVLEQMQAQAVAFSQQVLANHDSGAVALAPQTAVDISRNMMEKIASENKHGAVDTSDMQTIDLVGMLFQYMLSDDHLPDSVKTLLSYLHTPFLKIAFIDKGFFAAPDHPARVLLNSLAEAGVRWVSNDGSDQYDIFTKIKATVFRLLQEFKNDTRIFAQLLLEFNAYTHNVARRQELMERRVLEKVQGEEKLREAKIQVNAEVRSRTDNRDMPSAILLLLLQPWSDYLSFVLLRYGDRSDSWTRALQVIDDLLWSLEPKTTQPDKVKQMELQEGLLAALERGFETIGYERAKGRKLLDAVSSLHRMALLSRKVEPAPAPMRSKLESLAAEKAGQFVEQLQPVTAEESKIVESLRMVEFGTWFEFEGGKRLKVAWYNKKTQHYMLVDQQGRKVSLASSVQMARDMLAGRARVIAGSTKPFFERALENIYHTLNEQADTRKGKVTSINKKADIIKADAAS
jgi:hypothetical protein